MKHAVAVCHLGAPLDVEAEPIAHAAGLAAYDVKLRLGGILPSVLAFTSTIDEAVAMQGRLHARGHGVVVVDPASVVPASEMIRVRRFAIERDRFVPNDREDGVPFSDITAFVRAATATAVLRKLTVKEPVYTSPGRPQATEPREHVSHETTTSDLLYVMRENGTPLVMVAHEAKYLSLGREMRATEHDNFLVTIDLLRRAAPRAVYDDRFASRAHDSHKLAVAHGSDRVEAKGDIQLDLLVHVLARWLTRGSGPYRSSEA